MVLSVMSDSQLSPGSSSSLLHNTLHRLSVPLSSVANPSCIPLHRSNLLALFVDPHDPMKYEVAKKTHTSARKTSRLSPKGKGNPLHSPLRGTERERESGRSDQESSGNTRMRSLILDLR